MDLPRKATSESARFFALCWWVQQTMCEVDPGAEREFPGFLTAPRGKKPHTKIALTREKQKKTPKSTKTPPKNNKNTKKHQKNTNFFSRLRAKNKSQRQKKKANSHGPAGAIKQEKFPLCPGATTALKAGGCRSRADLKHAKHNRSSPKSDLDGHGVDPRVSTASSPVDCRLQGGATPPPQVKFELGRVRRNTPHLGGPCSAWHSHGATGAFFLLVFGFAVRTRGAQPNFFGVLPPSATASPRA